MAADTGAPLVLMNVLVGSQFYAEGPLFPPFEDPAPAIIDGATTALAELRREAESTGAKLVSTHVRTGTPWHEIVEYLRADPTFDLVILGTHGRTGLKHILLGSVAERVVRHAPCAVLVVR